MATTLAFLDRRVSNTTSGVSASFAASTTTWTLPYAVATDGSEGTLVVMIQGTNTILTTTHPTTTTVAVAGTDYTNTAVWIGIQYGFTWKLSTLYFRDKNGEADSRGTLRLRYLELNYENSTDFVVTISAPTKVDRTYTFTKPTPSTGTYLIPLLQENETLTISITSSTAGGLGFSGYAWDGDLYVRARPI